MIECDDTHTGIFLKQGEGIYEIVEVEQLEAEQATILFDGALQFKVGMEAAAKIADDQMTFTDSDERMKLDIAAAIRAEIKK